MLNKCLLWCFSILVSLSTLLIIAFNRCVSSRFGVDDHVCEWFHSYFSGRTWIFSTSVDTCNAMALICSVPQGSVVSPLLFIKCTEDVEDLIETFSVKDHIYADDTRLLTHMQLTEVLQCQRNLEQWASQIQVWCDFRRSNNPDKTEIIWFRSKENLAKLKAEELCLHLIPVEIKPFTMVRDLGVWLDSKLTMDNHISRTTSCFHPRRLHQLHGVVSQSTMHWLVLALVLSWLDYCNAVLAELPSITLDLWWRVLYIAVSLIAGLGSWVHVTEQMNKLQSDTVFQVVWWCTPLWLVTVRNTYLTLSILCQHYLDRIDFKQLLVASSTSPGQELFSWKELSLSPIQASSTRPQNITDVTNRKAFKSTLQTLF